MQKQVLLKLLKDSGIPQNVHLWDHKDVSAFINVYPFAQIDSESRKRILDEWELKRFPVECLPEIAQYTAEQFIDRFDSTLSLSEAEAFHVAIKVLLGEFLLFILLTNKEHTDYSHKSHVALEQGEVQFVIVTLDRKTKSSRELLHLFVIKFSNFHWCNNKVFESVIHLST